MRQIALAFLLAAIFILDTISRLEIAAAVFYIVVILWGARFLALRGMINLCVICTILTILSYFLTQSGAPEAGLINCIIALMALLLTTYIVSRAQMAEKRALTANEQLTRVARVQSLGELTASIAHEINQPLGAASASADACRNWLQRQEPDIERAKNAVDRITREIKRAAEIIARIRSLSKNEAPKKEVFDFNYIVGETLTLSNYRVERNDIHLEWNRGEGALNVTADKVQMMQVVSNLLLNAIDALNHQEPDDRFITVTTARHDGRVILTVTDTGCGLSDSDLHHLFDAFWTKREGGTGLGLTLCRAIVEAHKGILTAGHNPHGGAVFTVSLPETNP